jgi:hypothetical protein
MVWQNIQRLHSKYKANVGDKIPSGHIYFGEAPYTPECYGKSRQEIRKNSKTGLRLYVDQKHDTENGRRVHGISMYAFPDNTFNIIVFPERDTPVLLRQLGTMDYEVEEVDSISAVPYRVDFARTARALTKEVPNSSMERESAIKVLIKGQSIGEVKNENAGKILQNNNALRIGKEFMAADEFKATLESLESKGFLSQKTMSALPMFQDAAQAYAAGNLNERAVRHQLISLYTPRNSMPR